MATALQQLMITNEQDHNSRLSVYLKEICHRRTENAGFLVSVSFQVLRKQKQDGRHAQRYMHGLNETSTSNTSGFNYCTFINDSEFTSFNSKHTSITDTDTRKVIRTRALTQGPIRKLVVTVLPQLMPALLFITFGTPLSITAEHAWLMQS